MQKKIDRKYAGLLFSRAVTNPRGEHLEVGTITTLVLPMNRDAWNLGVPVLCNKEDFDELRIEQMYQYLAQVLKNTMTVSVGVSYGLFPGYGAFHYEAELKFGEDHQTLTSLKAVGDDVKAALIKLHDGVLYAVEHGFVD